jgi:hypothetical protein
MQGRLVNSCRRMEGSLCLRISGKAVSSRTGYKTAYPEAVDTTIFRNVGSCLPIDRMSRFARLESPITQQWGSQSSVVVRVRSFDSFELFRLNGTYGYILILSHVTHDYFSLIFIILFNRNILVQYTLTWGTPYRSWLRHSATSQ